MFWHKLPVDFYDPKKIGDKYESIVDSTFIIEYVKTEGTAIDPIFVFNNQTY